MRTAIEIINILNENNFEAYLVGGWVRDKILNIPSSDIDIATNATPTQVQKIFKQDHIRIIPTGIDHGTLTIIHEHLNPGIGYEITTFRHDVSCDGRNATIKFADTIMEDLSRRDFTMNAIAYNPITDEYIDPFNGISDISNKIIRSVGDANRRFKEDHLRMLRAFRFKANFQFKIHSEVYDAINNNAHLIQNISAERIKMEVDKCFTKSEKPSDFFIEGMDNIFRYIFPELLKCLGFQQNKYHKYDVFMHTMLALDAIPKEYPLIRWAILFHDLGKPKSCENYGTPDASFHCHEIISEKIAKNIMKRLKFSNDDIAYISNLVKHHMFKCDNDMTDRAIRRFVSKLGKEYVNDICILKYGDRVGNGTKTVTELDIANTGLRKRFDKILSEEAAFKVSDLKISGHDIMEILNIKQGKEIGIILNSLFELVMDDPSINNYETLTKMIKEEFNC